MNLLLGIVLILATSCTEIFETEIDIADCSNSDIECSYAESIQPIFNLHCTVCHNSASPASGLSLESYSELISRNVIIPGDSLNSRLRQLLTGESQPIMPPTSYENLQVSTIHMISKWIQSGANNN